jgi:hypothetical protein
MNMPKFTAESSLYKSNARYEVRACWLVPGKGTWAYCNPPPGRSPIAR